MKKPLVKKLLALLLCVSVLSTLMIVPVGNSIGGHVMQVYGVTEQEIQQEKDKQAAIEKEQKAIQSQIASMKSSLKDTESYLKSLDETMSGIEGDIYQLGLDIAAKEAEIEKTKTELAAAQQEQQRQSELMKLRIKFMYENNEQSYLTMFLESESLADLLNKVEYVSKLSQYDRNMLDEYKAVVETVASVQEKLETELTELNNSKIAAEAKKAALEIALKEKQAELVAYNDKLSALEEQESALDEKAEEQLALIAQKEKQLKEQQSANNSNNSAGTITNPYESGFIWPTVSKRITWRYGQKSSGFHYGVDIGASTPGVWGDPIYVVADGVVTLTTYDSSGGYWISVYHESKGVSTVYKHLSKFLVSVGDTVKQGDKIALMGSTGASTGAHLHFGVVINGKYVNPEPYIGIK